MKKQNIYSQWKTSRMQVPVPDRFTASVMQQIQTTIRPAENDQPADTFHLHSRLSRIIAAWGMILLGLARIGYILANLLQSQILVH